MDRALLSRYAAQRRMTCGDCDADDADACYHAAKRLQASQVAVHAIATTHAAGRMQHHARGALVWHATGAGKTCASTGIMDAFWDTESQLYFVTSPAALASNPPAKFHECARMFPRFAALSIPDIARRFAQRVTFLTYARLAHLAGLHRPRKDARPLRDPVFVIDEAHTLFRPLANQRSEMRAILRYIGDTSIPMHLFLLTATPGETADEVLALLNLLVPSGDVRLEYPRSPQDAADFVRRTRYMVSRYDASGNRNMYPRVVARDVRVPMGAAQFERYYEALANTADPDRDYDHLRDTQRTARFYASARRFANALYQAPPDITLGEFSAKLVALLRNIANHQDEKHYVYSAFSDDRGMRSQGIQLIAHVLRMVGYEQLSHKEARALAPYADDPPILKKRRFIVVTSKELGARKERALSDLVHVFNWDANRHGDYVHVMLASQSYNESIDLKTVRHVHIFDPMLSAFAYDQTVGRAVRRCSHAQLRHKDDWTVTIHRYFALKPDEQLRARAAELAERIRDANDASEARALRAQLRRVEKLSQQDVPMIDDLTARLAAARHAPVRHVTALLELAALDCACFKRFRGACAWDR